VVTALSDKFCWRACCCSCARQLPKSVAAGAVALTLWHEHRDTASNAARAVAEKTAFIMGLSWIREYWEMTNWLYSNDAVRFIRESVRAELESPFVLSLRVRSC